MEKNTLRIAVLSSPVITAPTNSHRVPRGWSGAPENMMLAIADGLVQRDHEVTLFAAPNTQTLAQHVSPPGMTASCYEDPTIGLKKIRPFEQILIANAYQRTRAFDIIHSPFTTTSAGYASIAEIRDGVPTIATIHSPLTDHDERELYYFANAQHNVSISNRQRRGFEFMNWAATIYHGIDPQQFPFNPQGGEGLVMVSRMHQEKSPHIAVDIAEKLGIPLTLVGSNWGEEASQPWGTDPYWEELVTHMEELPNINHVEFVSYTDTAPYYQQAKAQLFPAINREEPFGLTVIEAMACGTPVVAFAKGSMPELIVDGETGFLVNASEKDIRGDWITQRTGEAGFMEAVQRLYSLSKNQYLQMRQLCRQRVEQLFTLDRMIGEYEELYRKLLRRDSPLISLSHIS